MSAALTPRYGFEIELLAPPGASRRDLADALARRCGGSYRPTFHHDAEPSLVENRPVSEWVVSTDEIKALAGLAHQVGVTLDATVFADAQRAWVGGDVAEPDLESIADEWELEPSSLKVIAMLDVPGTAALLDPCTSVDD